MEMGRPYTSSLYTQSVDRNTPSLSIYPLPNIGSRGMLFPHVTIQLLTEYVTTQDSSICQGESNSNKKERDRRSNLVKVSAASGVRWVVQGTLIGYPLEVSETYARFIYPFRRLHCGVLIYSLPAFLRALVLLYLAQANHVCYR